MKPTIVRQYLVDKKGHHRAVVIDMDDYSRMMEDMEDLRIVAERKDNSKLGAARFVARLKKDGII